MANRGDRLALIRQARCIQEGLRQGQEENGASALRDFAFHCLDLGEHARGFGLLTAILTNEPADIWTYNTIASQCWEFGYGATARAAAERGLQLLAQTGDPDRLKSQFRDRVIEYEAGTDRDGAAQVLREAMTVDFASGLHHPVADLARQLVPELELVQVKELPSMPDQTELESIAAGLRSAFGDEIARYQSWGQRLQRLIGPSAPGKSAKPPVGRNEPCPCGSGKKFKKCCGSPTKS